MSLVASLVSTLKFIEALLVIEGMNELDARVSCLKDLVRHEMVTHCTLLI